MTPTPTAVPLLWIDPSAPETLRQAALKNGFALSEAPEQATIRFAPAQDGQDVDARWVYALVAAFPTVADGMTWDELNQAWDGKALEGQEDALLVMDDSTRAAMTAFFGREPGPGAVRVVPAQAVSETLWQNRAGVGILPFEDIHPQLKVLELDGQSPIRKDFREDVYRLQVGFAASGLDVPARNRDESKVTTVVMTGVTALVRATAFRMENYGVNYPGEGVRAWLTEADITHISNEIPFATNCPFPDPGQRRLIFCSDPKYIDLLDYVGVDVVELTGNHFQDWGKEATLMTVQMYRERGWPYFGGGADLADAQKPALLERNGVKFAFIGCNPVGPEFAWARSDGWPGAAPCGDFAWIENEIRSLKSQGYIVIATFQYFEYYTPDPRPWQIRDFRRMADAGADIVSGSQAHLPQAMEFYKDSFIHYGLGNLFFDQMGYDLSDGVRTTKTRYEFLDRYVFYDGKLMSVELLTAMLENFARPRPMTPEERAAFLQEYFIASGWNK